MNSPNRSTVLLVATFLILFSNFSPAHGDTITPDQFEVAEGFEVTVWATTPQLYNPTNFDIDAKGRMWVTEAVNYRNFRNEALGLTQDSGDRVVVLEDTDGDGKADKSHTFVRDPDLVAPLGIGVVDNKVIVSCSPNILIYTDVNRDAVFDPKVDTKEVFLTGFRGLDHDHSLHSVKVGPDGLWYFNVGNAGAHTVTDKSGWTLRAGSSYAGGTPHLKENTPGRKSDDGRTWVGGVAMRIRPDGTGLEPIGHNFRNVYEECLSSFGDVFHADNDDPPACRTTWLMEFGNAGFSSADGSRAWKLDQRPGQPVGVAEWRQEDPGTIPAGDVYGYGAPTGVSFGENGSFDSKYQKGLLLISESARGEIFAYEPTPQGAGFTLERSVFLKLKPGSQKQGWFRPSDVAIGADGAIYVSDWYDPGVGGHRMTDKTASGTVYRIAPKGFKPVNPKLDLESIAGQIEALKNPAVNVRALGFEALKKSLADKPKEALDAILNLTNHPNSLIAARGIWLLPYGGKAGTEALEKYLADATPQKTITMFRAIRRAAITATDDSLNVMLVKARNALSEHPSSAVRREVALSLREISWDQRKRWLVSIAEQFDGWDRWYLEAIGIASEGHEAEAYELMVEESGIEPVKWDRRLAGIAWRLHPPKAVAAIAERAMTESLPYADRARMMTALAFTKDESAAQAMLKIATKGPDDLQPMARWWGKNRDGNDWKKFQLGDEFPDPPKYKKPKKFGTPRLDFGLAGEPEFTKVGDRVKIDVDVRGAKRLYLVAERVMDEAEIKARPGKWQKEPVIETAKAKWANPRLINNSNTELRLSEMQWSMAFSMGQPTKIQKPNYKWERRIRPNSPTLNSSEESAIHVETRSIVAYDLSESEFERFVATAIVEEESVSAGKQVRFSVHVDRSPSNEAIPSPEKVLALKGMASHGRALFFSNKLQCSGCHSVSGFGGGVGPDLTAIAKKHAPPVLVEGIMNPSAAISMGFETLMVLTEDGKTISGLIVSAGDPVVLKDAEGKTHTIPKDQVEAMKSSKVSMMPSLKKELTTEELASILAFLQEMNMED